MIKGEFKEVDVFGCWGIVEYTVDIVIVVIGEGVYIFSEFIRNLEGGKKG